MSAGWTIVLEEPELSKFREWSNDIVRGRAAEQAMSGMATMIALNAKVPPDLASRMVFTGEMLIVPPQLQRSSNAHQES